MYRDRLDHRLETAFGSALGWLGRHARRLLHSRRGTKRAFAILTDLACCIVAAWISFMLRLGELIEFNDDLLLFVALQAPLFMIVFFAYGVYANMFRFSGPKVLAQILRCCILLTVPSVLIFGVVSIDGIPRTVSVIHPIMFFMLVGLSRIIARFLLLELARPEARKRVLIYGAGDAGRKLGLSMEHEAEYDLVAYVDDDASFGGQRIEGVPIIGPDEADRMLAGREFELVLLALPTITRSRRSAIVDRLQKYGVHVQTLPGINEIVAGEVSVNDLREIEITDLLARDPVVPQPDLLSRSITGKTVLVTGAGGSIGSELCRQIVHQDPARLVLFEMTEAALYAIDLELRAICAASGLDCEIVSELGSLVNSSAVERLFERWRPQTVYHAAAYKHVPLVEANPVSGVRNNVLGTLHCALASRRFEVERFVLVSTDKAVRPTNVMGASKRMCELLLQGLAEEHGPKPVFAMVRFGNVLGSSGSVVPQFKAQIAGGGPVTLTHSDITRFFMTIPEAAGLVIQAGSMAQGGEVYLLDMGEPVRIYDLAKSMITMSGRTLRNADNPDGDIEIVEVGLRPGEKLYEELLIDAEALPTDHPRIFRAREDWISWTELTIHLQQMRESIDCADNEGIIRLLSQLVSGYGQRQIKAAVAGAAQP